MARILTIDDSSFQRMKVRAILKAEGHEVLEAENGRDGLDMIRFQAPDCVLLDLIMPELEGIGVLHALRELKTEMPVIIVTADVQRTAREECFQLGVFGFINKPMERNELCEKINQALSLQKGAARLA